MIPDSGDIVVVGASLAGLRAAEELRTRGFGGTITLIGDEPHLPYDRPPLSKAALAGDREPESTALRTAAPMDGLDLEFRVGEAAVSLDVAGRSVKLEGGDLLNYDELLIATGARPRRLPFGGDLAGVHTLRTLDDCRLIRDELVDGSPKVVVIGAGFIGAEVAATVRGLGLDVTVVEPLSVPLERALGTEIGEVVARMHRDEGVDLRLGTGVADIVGSDRVEQVVLTDESTVEADVVVVGVGVVPNTDWLETSDLTLDDGIVCDATCRAGPSAVAAGDVARWPNQRFSRRMRLEHWDNAIGMGQAAARRMLATDDEADPFVPVPWFWSDQFDAKIQLAGITAGADATHTFGSVDERRFGVVYGRNGQLIGGLGWSRPRDAVRLQMMIEQGTTYDDAVAAFTSSEP